MTRVVAVVMMVSLLGWGGLTLAATQEDTEKRPAPSTDAPGTIPMGRGMAEMLRFMESERMPQAMLAMIEMARRMGDGDPMLGMVRMMEMMSMMGQMNGMMGSTRPQPTQ